MNYTFSLQVSHGFKSELITGGLNWSNPKFWLTLSLLKSKPKIYHLESQFLTTKMYSCCLPWLHKTLQCHQLAVNSQFLPLEHSLYLVYIVSILSKTIQIRKLTPRLTHAKHLKRSVKQTAIATEFQTAKYFLNGV